MSGTEQTEFISRGMVEKEILFPVGAMLTLQGHINGNKIVECKLWNTRKAYQCGTLVSEILAALFPNDALFLVNIDWSKPLTANQELYEVLFRRVYDPMTRLVAYTLDITEDKDIRSMIETTRPMDILNLFVTIVNQEINNDTVAAIIKKAQELLVEKFRLQSDSLSLQSILGAFLQMPSNDSHLTNLLSTLTTQKLIPPDHD